VTTASLPVFAVHQLADFEHWLRHPSRRAQFAWRYHHGELSRDKQTDPNLAAVADAVRLRSDVSAPIVSRCGHVRGWETGTGECRLVTWREGGTFVHAAVRATAPPVGQAA
jgi:hypothetical protein